MVPLNDCSTPTFTVPSACAATPPSMVAASKLAAAQASLELARMAADRARAMFIDLPIAKTLPLRKQATTAAVQALENAASYGFVETSTAATYEIGNVYHDFALALTHSQRPENLQGEALQQYSELLEEQAEPFDEQAIKAVQQYKFKPAMENGKPVPVPMNVEVNFQIF